MIKYGSIVSFVRIGAANAELHDDNRYRVWRELVAIR